MTKKRKDKLHQTQTIYTAQHTITPQHPIPLAGRLSDRLRKRDRLALIYVHCVEKRRRAFSKFALIFRSTPLSLMDTNFLIAEASNFFHADDPAISSTSLDERAVQMNLELCANARLEEVGFRVGYRLIGSLLATNRCTLLPHSPSLDLIKFICKEFWVHLYGKRIDKLKTNQKKLFVLHDNNFQGLGHLDCDAASFKAEAGKLCGFPAGLLRGCLSNLGVDKCTVDVEVNGPQVFFIVNILD